MSWTDRKKEKLWWDTATPANGAFPFSLALTFLEEHCDIQWLQLSVVNSNTEIPVWNLHSLHGLYVGKLHQCQGSFPKFTTWNESFFVEGWHHWPHFLHHHRGCAEAVWLFVLNFYPGLQECYCLRHKQIFWHPGSHQVPPGLLLPEPWHVRSFWARFLTHSLHHHQSKKALQILSKFSLN